MSVVTDVDLTNIGAGKLAGVANLKGNIELGFGARLQADRLHFNVAVAEGRVREAEAERKQWIHVVSFIARPRCPHQIPRLRSPRQPWLPSLWPRD